MIEGLRLLRTALTVRDLDVSSSFYAHLGFEERGRTEVGDEARIAVLGLPGEPNRLQLTQPLRRQPPPAGAAYLLLEVANLDSALRALAEAGIEHALVPPPDDEHGTRTSILRDPDGHGVELMERSSSTA